MHKVVNMTRYSEYYCTANIIMTCFGSIQLASNKRYLDLPHLLPFSRFEETEQNHNCIKSGIAQNSFTLSTEIILNSMALGLIKALVNLIVI